MDAKEYLDNTYEQEGQPDVNNEFIVRLMTEYAEMRTKEDNLRVLADMDNLRKRVAKERIEMETRIKAESLIDIFTIADDIHSAQSTLTPDKAQILNGIASKVDTLLSKHGMVSIQTDVYDKDLHEVIHVITSNKKLNSPRIRSVVSKGYKSGDTIIRHPKVIIEQWKTEKSETL